MSVLQEARHKVDEILSSIELFSIEVTMLSPDEVLAHVNVLSGHTYAYIDPDTGQGTSSEQARIHISVPQLLENFGEIPVISSDEYGRPWRIIMTDAGGVDQTFKLKESLPDNTLGLVSYYLEKYEDD